MDALEAADRIRAGKLRTGTYDLCLDEDLVQEYEQLLIERDRQVAAKSDSLAGGGAPVELDRQIGELLERMQEATLTLKFQALSRPRFRQLCDAYPARRGEDGKLTHSDDVIGVNFDAFFERVVPLALVEPKLDADTLKTLMEEHVTDRQWQELTDVVWLLNRGKVDLPFSSSASKGIPTSSPR